MLCNLPIVLSLSLLLATSDVVYSDAGQYINASQSVPITKSKTALRGFLGIFRPAKSKSAANSKPFTQKNSKTFLPTKQVVGSIVASVDTDAFGQAAEKNGLIGLEMRGLITAAVAYNDEINVSKSQVKITQIQIWRELASYVPTISMSVDIFRSGLGLNKVPNGPETSELKFSLNLPLFTSGKRHFALKAAKSNQKAALGRAQAVRNDLAGQVISALLQYKQAEQTVALLGQNVGSIKFLLAAVQNRQKQGFASVSDVFYVQANLASLRRQREATISNQNQLKAQLESLIQAPLKTVPKLPALNKLIQLDEEQLVAQAIISDPTLKAAQHTATAQGYASRSAVGSYLPQVNLYGRYDVVLNKYAKSNQSDEWKIGVRLTMPLVDLTTVTDISEAKERSQLASYQASDTRRNVELSVRSLSREYQSVKKQVGLANLRVNYLRKIAKSEAVKYDKGVGTLDKVLDQKQILVQARIDSLDTKMTAYWAAYQLLIGTGHFEGGNFSLSDRILFSQLR